MCIVGILVGIILIIVGFNIKYDSDGVTILIGIIVVCVTIIGSVLIVGDAVESKYIDDRIAMYQEENETIESDIEKIVVNYLEHENKTFDVSEINSPTTLVQMYPELKSDTLVQQQMEIYKSNNDQIKSLKNKEIDCNRAKWLLYFGGK